MSDREWSIGRWPRRPKRQSRIGKGAAKRIADILAEVRKEIAAEPQEELARDSDESESHAG